MRKNRGSSLAQYAIILALLCVPIVVALTGLGQTIYDQLISLNNYFTGNNELIQENKIKDSILTESLLAGELKGSLTSPQKQCTANVCAIDYGEFTLNGISDNFGNFVETSGTSGGTEMLSTVLDQIADYLEESGDVEGAEEYRKLSNLGHLMADFHEAIENSAIACQSENLGSDDSILCLKRELQSRSDKIQVPENLQDVLTRYSDFDIERLVKDGVIIGEAKKDYLEDSSENSSFQEDASRYPSYAMVNMYETIMTNPGYSDELKTITEEIYRNISDLAFQQAGNSNSAMRHGSYDMEEYDPVTGENLGSVEFILSEDLREILEPNASFYTDIDSALICVSSGNQDEKNKCHSDNKYGNSGK